MNKILIFIILKNNTFTCGFFTKVTCAFLLQEIMYELSECQTFKPHVELEVLVKIQGVLTLETIFTHYM